MKESQLNLRECADWLRFDTCGDSDLEQMVIGCGLFKAAFDRQMPPRWLTLIGATDTGKPIARKGSWRHLRDMSNWEECEYLSEVLFWPRFVRELRDPESNARKRLTDMIQWPVLLVDDIGAEQDTTGFVTAELNTLLGCRVGKWTIITSNMTLEQLAGLEPRNATRIIREKGNIHATVTTKSYSLRGLPKPAEQWRSRDESNRDNVSIDDDGKRFMRDHQMKYRNSQLQSK